MTSNTTFGLTWGQVLAAQQKQPFGTPIDTKATGDYGADPLGNGAFRMMPSGDIVNYAERCQRLSRKTT